MFIFVFCLVHQLVQGIFKQVYGVLVNRSRSMSIEVVFADWRVCGADVYQSIVQSCAIAEHTTGYINLWRGGSFEPAFDYGSCLAGLV